MKKGQTAFDTFQLFCNAWFHQRDVDHVCTFLDEAFCFVGTGIDEFAHDPSEMYHYVKRDILEISEPFDVALTLIQQQELDQNTCNLSVGMRLSNTQYHWQLRGFVTMRRQASKWHICTLWFSEPSTTQQGDEHYPKTIVMENLAKQRQELLNNSLPGGMMGGYIDEGFPFYFINDRMLEYLGYESVEAFILDIDGKISNCMHPDDREVAEQEVYRQMSLHGEYVIEYRMRKSDGTYIWVHDLGHEVIAENGQPAIISVCIDITAQKKAQAEILHLYNNVPGAVFRVKYNENFTIVEANEGLYDLMGYTKDEFIAMGNHMAAVIHPDDLKAVRSKLLINASEGNMLHDEHRLICKDGSIKWIALKTQIISADDEEPYFYGFLLDITDEKLLQERSRELYEQEMTYFAQTASSEGSIQGRVNVSKNKVEIYQSNENYAIMEIGESYDQAIRNLMYSSVDTAYGTFLYETLERHNVLSNFMTGKSDYHFEFLRRQKDQDAFWSSTNFRFHQNPETGDIIAFFYTIDVTKQKIQEQLLHKITEIDYEVLSDIDMLHDTYHVISFHQKDHVIIPAKGRFQEKAHVIADTTMDEQQGREYLAKLDFTYMKQELSENSSYNFMIETKDTYGNLRVKRYHVFYISEELKRVCIARADVTDILRQEQIQKEALASALSAAEQANAAKTDFLSRMSHEIRTPMNAIIGMSTIAAQAIGNDEQISDCISKIGISSRFLLSLINDILDMSRIESGKMLLKNEKIPMEEFLNGINVICYSQAAAKRVEYECIVDHTIDDFYIGDAMKLQQVLLNILSNAIKFTGEGGKVTFTAAARSKGKTGVTLRFIVNDTGIGIDEDFLQHMFEPFAQESIGTTAVYGGTGLGLSIAKNIVDMMGGKIIVRSIKGIGSEFIIDVQLGVSKDELLLHHRKRIDPNFSTLKTLVVDDDVAVCESAVVTLKEMEIEAEWVDSGRKAIERVRSLYERGSHFDMILIDWKMPDIDGIETAKRIRSIVGSEVTIIIMTAYDWTSIEHEARLAGANMLMSKPMFKSSLVSAFSKALGKKAEMVNHEKPISYDFRGKRVLLVEDNAINTEVAIALLKSKGFEVDTAENGLRAIEIFSKTKPGYYDAILMDIRMPQMDGLTTANNIRHMSNCDAKSIPIIAMTANAFDDDIEKSKAAGMNAHLAKPIEPERLYQVLYDFILNQEEE